MIEKMKKVWDLDGYFKITTSPDGVYLTVYAPVGAGESVKVEDVITEIEAREYKDVDIEQIKKVVKESLGIPVKIGSAQKVAHTTTLVVEIMEDRMSAYLTIVPPPGERADVDVEDVVQALKKEGVVFGIDTDAIAEALNKEIYHKAICVAKGRTPVAGMDARVEFKFRKEAQKSPLKEDKDGRVNFRELGLIENVNAGQLLAKKIPPTPGTPGVTVTGEQIPAKDGEDVEIPAGKGTKLSEDGSALYADCDGRVLWTGQKIEVETVYEIKGDIGFETGNIEFKGSLIVGGNVTSGFSVSVTGDVEVRGCVERATVKAGGDIRVKNGILGRGDERTYAKGSIYAKFLENADVCAEKDVYVTEAILHSNVDAGGRVIVQGGRKSAIIGGRIRAKEEINARSVGSWAEVNTELEVGVDPRTRDEIIRLEEQIEADKRNFNELKLGIRTLLKQKEKEGGLPSEKEALLAQHLRAQNLLMARLRDTTERMIALQKELSGETSGKICVFDTVYPGTKITVRTTTLLLKREYKYSTFSVKAGQIRVSSYEEPSLKRKE
jgi:hypothetical protein